MLPDRTDFLSDLEIIHNKSLFDSLNEALDFYRPYSINGVPYPWRPSPSAIARFVRDDEVEEILERAKDKVLFWSTFRAGFIGIGLEIDAETPEKKEEILIQIKEERLSKALAIDVL